MMMKTMTSLLLSAGGQAAGLSDVNATLQAALEREQQRKLEAELRKPPSDTHRPHPGRVWTNENLDPRA
eukprot:1657418-Rhodomonas_salina.1